MTSRNAIASMAGAGDKARFYLEQYVPELQEYERKEIFTRDEIISITSKRSDFEHTLNARGSKPSDYARYATYEMNLDSLRKKRCKRLGVKGTSFSGQRTIFFLLDRATKKFPGDMGLWMQYINFCQSEKANKKIAKVFTSVLRLKPREWGLWVLAAKHYAESQGDMNTARSYMQRGLRFCKDERKLWLEYLRLEMVYLAKLAARRKILGLDQPRETPNVNEDEEDQDLLMLPSVTAEDIDPDAGKAAEGVDADVFQKLASAPAYSGAIPIAIFDAAMKQFGNSTEVSEEFFDLCASFDQVPSTRRILQHILDQMRTTAPNSADIVICEAKMQLFGIEAQSAELPEALGLSLATVEKARFDVADEMQSKFATKAVLMVLPYLSTEEELDEDITIALKASLRRHLRWLSDGDRLRAGRQKDDAISDLLTRLRKDAKDLESSIVEESAIAMGLR